LVEIERKRISRVKQRVLIHLIGRSDRQTPLIPQNRDQIAAR